MLDARASSRAKFLFGINKDGQGNCLRRTVPRGPAKIVSSKSPLVVPSKFTVLSTEKCTSRVGGRFNCLEVTYSFFLATHGGAGTPQLPSLMKVHALYA